MSERKHVEHYTQGNEETIDGIFGMFGFEGGMCYILGNIRKYGDRALFKGQLRSDLEKISNYAIIAIEKLDEHEAELESEEQEKSFGFTIPVETEGR